MPTIRDKNKNKTRKALLKAALAHFARCGLAEARTADIAAAAGVSHGTVFVHFPTRDDLLAAAIEEFGITVAGRLHHLAEKGGGVRGILAAHLDGLIEFEPFYTRLVTQATTLPDAARNAMTAIQSAISFHLYRAAEREMDQGKIRQMPMHLLFNTWIGLIHYYLANAALFCPRGSVLSKRGPELLEHFLSLVADTNQ